MGGLREAGHTEQDPQAKVPLLVLAACLLPDRPAGVPRLNGALRIKVLPGTRAADIYRQGEIEESFACNYELNPAYRDIMERAGVRVSGVSAEGGVRLIELPAHPFFLGTGFLPQLSSTTARPHPLVLAYVQAAARYHLAHAKRE